MATLIVSQSVRSPEVPTVSPRPHATVYEIITSQILAELERGQVPWRKPWRILPPANLITKKPRVAVDVSQVARLRSQGASWRAISKQLGISIGTAHAAMH